MPEPEVKPKRTKFIDEVSDAVVEKMRDAWSEIRDLIASEPPTPTVNTPTPPPTHSAGSVQAVEPPTATTEPEPEPTPPEIPSTHSEPRRRPFNILR